MSEEFSKPQNNQNLSEAILVDTPLEDPKDDRLGYAPFARNLAEALRNIRTEDSLVFALHGDWGTGKTTCLNFVLHYIAQMPEENRPIIMRFNPWWFSGHGDLLVQFFRELLKTFQKNKLESIASSLATFFDLISEIPEPTGLGKFGGKTLSAVLKKIGKEEKAWEAREKIKCLLRKQNRRILVLIDDIDRLTVDEIRDLFKVIKAVADFPRCTYLLAFDKSVVVEALKETQGIPGEAYLEKIVQIPFELPVPDKAALRKWLFEQLGLIFADTPEELADQIYFANVYWDGIDHFINTVRSIKLLTNTLKINYHPVKGEVNSVDFITIETLRLFVTKVYHLIRFNPDMFAGKVDSYGVAAQHAKDTLKAFHEEWVKQLPENDRDSVKKLLARIFPKLDYVFGNTIHGDSEWRRQLRICSSDIFPVYFRLAVPEGEIAYSEMRTILMLGKESTAFGNKLLGLVQQHRPDGSTRVSAFLERIEDFTQKDIPKEQIPEILQALFDVGDKLLVLEDEGRGLFSWGNDIRIGRIMFQLLKRYDSQEERFKILQKVFRDGQAVSVIVGEVAVLGQQHGKYGAKEKDPEKECLVSLQHVGELEEVALQKIKEASSGGRLLELPHFSGVLYRWRDWESEEAVKRWVAKTIETDQDLANLLEGFLSKGYRQTLTDRVGEVKWCLSPKSLESFLNPVEIIGRCKNLIKSPPEWLKDMKKIAVETFIKEFELLSKGKSPNDL
ncbi:P-loop NTPase fold protein [Candidatus Oleimmundimicrobium sp.]|uniref:KAP family P-loop NTPase fold protein n=1 Tax=Candidatus Oleimmundimicrobium sp. TaxID=3060597 RepID=UPI00272380B4|nr:P-loop NTPase fold protein [Candidatus Oleimmundimicrobium sp.]MDO8885967.1 P-loop NTPase fold protein [Candidatus Oleimmundimicrobium sp.]